MIGKGLEQSGDQEKRELAGILGNPEVDEMQRYVLGARAMAQERILLVLDDFEQNLTPDGSQFLDPDVSMLLAELLQNVKCGRVLITCRHPLPGFAVELQEVPIGPLSDAESRKLLLRLESLSDKSPKEVKKVLRVIGGHPRMLELLDALLRGGQGRLALVTKKLQELLRKAKMSCGELEPSLDAGLQRVILLGSRDVLLEVLLESARAEGTAEALLQLAASNLSVSAIGLARMMTEDPLEAENTDSKSAETAIAHLARLSLVFRRPNGEAWVHRWTAEGLVLLSEEEIYRRCFWRAGRYRVWRFENESGDLSDSIEAIRNFLAGHYWDDAMPVAKQCLLAQRRFRQSTGITALAAEILEVLPVDHDSYAVIADEEARAHFTLGWTGRAIDRFQSLLAFHRQRAEAEPERVDYQHSLSVFYQRMGDLYRALGEGESARAAFQESFEISERLATAEPLQADYQRSLSVSYIKMGEIYRSLGEGERARNAFLKSLEIRERLVAAEPQRDGYQRDLSAAYNKLGDLYRALGEGENARDAFQKDLKIAERLAAAEPQRADYQRDLSISHDKLGDLYRALGEGENARTAFEKGLKIAENLAAAEPQRADYQRDLSVSYNKMGDIYSSLGEGENARHAFQRSFAIIERLAAAEPQRADYQRDLAASYHRMGSVHLLMDNLPEARQAYSRALAICERRIAAEPTRADIQIDLWVPLTQLGMLEGRDGRNKIERALAIVERLDAEGRLPPSEKGKIEAARKLLAELI